MKYSYICEHCERPAFELTHLPSYGELADYRMARHLDGTPMLIAGRVVCDSCGREVRAFDVQRIRETP